MKLKYFFNPFAVIPDKLLLLIGIVTVGMGSALSYFNQVVFDGIFDVHLAPGISFTEAFSSVVVNIVVLAVFLFILGKIINPKTRMIDIMNVAFISRVPVYLVSFLIVLPTMKKISAELMENLNSIQHLTNDTSNVIFLLFFSFASLLLLLYSLIFLVFGFKTATNAKTWQHFLAFSIVILLAEIVTKLIIAQL